MFHVQKESLRVPYPYPRPAVSGVSSNVLQVHTGQGDIIVITRVMAGLSP